MSSEPPEEPHYRNEPHILSPASPKPIHFPTPTNIPVLEMQMDLDFNQMEPHMSDPAMHNTDVRPDFWRDPNEPPEEHQQTQKDGMEGAGQFSAGVENEGAVPEGESANQQSGNDDAPNCVDGPVAFALENMVPSSAPASV